jgi:DNA-binding HxlR family transcriptional regulator
VRPVAKTQLDVHHDYCPVFQQVMELLGRRWTGVILRELLNGPHRFSELKRAIPGLSDRLLSERLVELETGDILSRVVVDEHAIYQLTPRGEDLRGALNEIGKHAEKWANKTLIAERPGRRCESD